MTEILLAAFIAGLAGVIFGLSKGFDLAKQSLSELLWVSRNDNRYCQFCGEAHVENGGPDERPNWCKNVNNLQGIRSAGRPVPLKTKKS